MKLISSLIFCTIGLSTFAQKVEKISIPSHVAYKYCKGKVYEQAKATIQQELTGKPAYSLSSGFMILGPKLWERYKTVEEIGAIEGGKVRLIVDEVKLDAKLIQNLNDFELVWNQMRSEVADQDILLRKATYKELVYYWSIISFDIVEPLIVVETNEHNYILDIDPKTMTIEWLDEISK